MVTPLLSSPPLHFNVPLIESLQLARNEIWLTIINIKFARVTFNASYWRLDNHDSLILYSHAQFSKIAGRSPKLNC